MGNKIKVHENNQEIEYEVLFTLNDEKHNVSYIVYTDNQKNGENKVKIHMGRYSRRRIIPLESNKEKLLLKDVFNIVREEVLSNEN